MRKKRSDASGQDQNMEEAQFKTLGQTLNVCLFFEADKPEDYQGILSFVPVAEGEIKELAPVVLYYGKIPEQVSGNGPVHLIGKRDFNMFRRKRTVLKEWLATHEFDMLISFAGEKRDKSARVIEDIKAKIKVGPNLILKDQCFDISIGKPGEKMDLPAFYKQVKHYFVQLNINLNL